MLGIRFPLSSATFFDSGHSGAARDFDDNVNPTNFWTALVSLTLPLATTQSKLVAIGYLHV